MSISTVQDAFEEYEKKVRVPATQAERAKEVHPQVRDAVEADLGELFNRAFLAGSYARKVQTAPKLKDVDIIFVLNDPEGTFAASAHASLERLRTAAKTCDLVASPTRLGVRAVKLPIDGEEFTVDAVAALEDGFGGIRLARYLPDEGKDDWTPANPKGQMDAHWDRNKDTDGVFIPSVRIVKSWNQRHKWNSKNLLPSYLVESILFHSMTGKADFADAMVKFFRDAETHLSTSVPTVACPGSPGNYVDERLDDERRGNALQKVQSALADAEAAVAETDPGKAMDLWANVFGPAFPAQSGDTSALAAALRSRTARVSGAGVSVAANGGREVINSRPWRSE
jgi:hypothetical protein